MTLHIVLVGFGAVARQVAALLEASGERLAREGVECRIVGAATGRHGAAIAPAGLSAGQAAGIAAAGGDLTALHDPSAGPPPRTVPDLVRGVLSQVPAAPGSTVLVELTRLDVRTGQPAVDHIRLALEAGMHAVTANKGPVACAYRPLRDLAAARDRAFLFEGTVMDGIPVFSLVRETLPGVEVTGFRGVINSTTNHVLCAMEEGRALADALEEARAGGIAEADAALDIDGWDAAAKAAALANVLMGADLTPADVERRGIGDLGPADVRGALAEGRRLKLVASAARRKGEVRARVAPERVEAASLLGALNGMENALEIDTDLAGRVAIAERTPGLAVTAYAILADLVTIARRWQSPAGSPPRRSP